MQVANADDANADDAKNIKNKNSEAASGTAVFINY